MRDADLGVLRGRLETVEDDSTHTQGRGASPGLHADIHRMKLSARRRTDAVFPGFESSQRSRTFLFVGAACVVAAVADSNQVWLNENGIMRCTFR